MSAKITCEPHPRESKNWSLAGHVLVLLLFSLSAAHGFNNDSAQRRLQLEDYFRFETVGSTVISPDGRFVAFVRTGILENENLRHSGVWLVPVDGSVPPTRLTNPAFSASDPIWSPDGKLLVFKSRRNIPGSSQSEQNDFWFLRMDHPGEAFQIQGVEGRPIFSPDNQWIAFTKTTLPPSKNQRNDATDFERKIDERFKGRIYDWMNFRFDRQGYLPDPRDPGASPPEELYIVPRAGGIPRELTRLGVDVRSAVWRPDSRALAVIADSHQRDEYLYERADLWIVDLDGVVFRLTDDGYDHSSPSWAADGKDLAFLRSMGLSTVIASKQKHGAPVDLCRIPASGGAIENLTNSWDLIPENPQWSPDGRHIYFAAEISGNSHVFRIDTAGRVEQMTHGERQLNDVTFSSDGRRMATTVTDSTHPGEVFSFDINGRSENKLSGVNQGFLDEFKIAAVEKIRYSSEDGTPIDGWVVLPPGYDSSGGRYPLILSIHGGPHGAFGNSFDFQFQFWAANGYIVLFTNPRGSTGYGENFLWATWGGWGVLDYQDVMAGVDHVLRKYAVDEKRMAVTGYSYGGFMTNWIITQTDRFAAAISGAGISNWISDYGTADIPRTKESEFGGSPWESESGALLNKLSPINYAGRVMTPTLFIHGESDFRVPIEQGEQMYTALKKRKVPAKFIRYPDSYHGDWNPWNIVHRLFHELRWLNEYLRPQGT